MPTATIYTKGLSTNTRSWSDLDLDFQKHPGTKDIVIKKDVEAVKRSIRNLIRTNRYEKPFRPDIDGGVTRHLFGLSTAHTKFDISYAVENCISNYEPRAKVETVNVTMDLDRNGFYVTVIFHVVNSHEPTQVGIFLDRIR